MADEHLRTSTEFASHSWNAGSDTNLDYTLTFDVERDTLIVTGSERQLDDGYRSASNAFGKAAVILLIQLEDCALRTCIHGRSVDPNPERYSDWDMHILEESRHLGALQRYYHRRWKGRITGCEEIEDWLADILRQSLSPKSIEAALSFIEGAARGTALLLHSNACDPLLVRLCSFILADEQFHGEPSSSLPAKEIARPSASIVEFIEQATIGANCSEARRDLMQLFAKFSADWLDPSILKRIDADEIDQETAARQVRELGMLAATNAHDYLSRLKLDVNATPPPALAIEWLVAGLRGRGKEPISRRRWINFDGDGA